MDSSSFAPPNAQWPWAVGSASLYSSSPQAYATDAPHCQVKEGSPKAHLSLSLPSLWSPASEREKDADGQVEDLSFSKGSHPYAGCHLISPCGWEAFNTGCPQWPPRDRAVPGGGWLGLHWHLSVKLEQASAKQGSQQRSPGDCLGLKSDHVVPCGENDHSHSAVGEDGEA